MALDQQSGVESSENNENITPPNSSQDSGDQPDYLKIQEELESTKRELRQTSESQSQANKMLAGIKSVFVPEESSNSSPEDEAISYLKKEEEQAIAAFLDMQAKGINIPHTAKARLDSIKNAIDHLSYKAATDKRIAQLEAKLTREVDPNVEADKDAFRSMNNHLTQQVEALYGEADEDVIKAASDKINKEISRLKSADPSTWVKIVRSDGLKKQMVSHFLKKVIPPRAMHMLEQEKIQNTPLTREDIDAARKEAWEKYRENPTTLSRIMKKLDEEQRVLSFNHNFPNRRSR